MKKFFFAIATLCSVSLYGQTEVESSVIKILEKSAGAPNTASLGRYFDIPVNMSTGVASVQIPLYTIKTGNITLPISLSYHGSGIKVNDAPSWVGAGWILNCGGVIMKQINGLDDYYSITQIPTGQGYVAAHNYFDPIYDIDGDLGFRSMTAVIDSFNSAYAWSHANDLFKLLGRIIQNHYDGEADQYYYSNPESSGMIFYDQQTTKFLFDNINGWDASVSTNPYQPIGGWTLRNKSGITYGYGAEEKTRTPFITSGSSPADFYTSAWYLTNITDYVNSRAVSLSYNTSANRNIYQGPSLWQDYYSPFGDEPWWYFGQSSESTYRYGNDVTLSSVYFSEGKVEFIQDTAARLDIDGPKALKEIRVLDRNNALKKKFVFNYYYYASRLFLESVQEINYETNSANHSRPYRFNYDTLSLPPRFSYAQDVYGYYNGKTSNTTAIPTEMDTYDITGIAFANRRIDSNYTQAGILKQIAYPSGGSLNFQYENNRDYDSLIGGLRIKRVTNYDSVAGKKLVTEYRYVRSNGEPSGWVQYRPKFHYFYEYMSNGIEYGVCRVSSQPIYPLFSNQGSPIAYDEVEKIEIGDSVNLKSKFYFINYLNGGNDLPSMTTLQTDGKGVPFNKFPNLQNFNGLPVKKEVFGFQNGQYRRLMADSMEYSSLNQFNSYIWNVQAAWSLFGAVWVRWIDNPDPYITNPMNSVPSINAYKLFHESLVNNQSFSKAYDDNNNSSETAVFKKYDPVNGNVRKVTTTVSNGDTLNVYYKYACDFPETVSSDPVNITLYLMREQNMIGLPIEIISTRKPIGDSEMVTAANLYIYDTSTLKKHLAFTKNILFSSMTQAYADNSGFHYDSNYETESEILAFNSQNTPSEIQLRDKKQSIIWDNDNIIATALNTSVADIAASSFETAEKGGWTYSKLPVADAGAVTGKKVYNLDSSDVSKSSLQTGKTYIVSYWSNSGAKDVNGSSSIAKQVINNWTYYEHKVNNPSGGTIIVSGSGKIDELRLHLDGVLMNTYTYESLLGISSQADPDHHIIYYQYDGLGRLWLMRDQYGNILKKICYNYAGQTENCN